MIKNKNNNIQNNLQEDKVEDYHEKYFEEKFNGLHTQLYSEFSAINENIINILTQVTKTNSRVTHVEKDIVALQDSGQEYKDEITNDIGKTKNKKMLVIYRWVITSLIAILAIVLSLLIHQDNKKIPIQLFYEKNDSTLVIPKIFVRDEDNGELKEVSKLYYEFTKEQK